MRILFSFAFWLKCLLQFFFYRLLLKYDVYTKWKIFVIIVKIQIHLYKIYFKKLSLLPNPCSNIVLRVAHQVTEFGSILTPEKQYYVWGIFSLDIFIVSPGRGLSSPGGLAGWRGAVWLVGSPRLGGQQKIMQPRGRNWFAVLFNKRWWEIILILTRIRNVTLFWFPKSSNKRFALGAGAGYD